jgi:hypothetical protein
MDPAAEVSPLERALVLSSIAGQSLLRAKLGSQHKKEETCGNHRMLDPGDGDLCGDPASDLRE